MLRDKLLECHDLLKNQTNFTLLSRQLDFNDIVTELTLSKNQATQSYIPYKLKQRLTSLTPELRTLARKIVILRCSIDNYPAIFADSYSTSVIQQYLKTFSRIIDMCQKKLGWTDEQEDIYWKDLAMTRQVMYPAGAQVVEQNSGYGFKQGLSKNLSQSLAFLWLSLSQGGCRSYYQIHTHTPNLDEFNPKGWENCYLRITDMLERQPHIKGMFGGSWFYDPNLANISPRLMYLQQLPLEYGAHCFHVKPDTSGNALHRSATRRRLYKQGKYHPQIYLLVWPREAMLDWARQYRSQQNITVEAMEASL